VPRDLRADARTLILAGLRSADPARLVARALADPATLASWAVDLAVDDAGPPASPLDREVAGDTLLVAIGKAAGGMARGAAEVLGHHLAGGVVVTADGTPLPDLPGRLRTHRAAHPLPDARSVAAARDIRHLLEGAGGADRVLVLLSGGGSALVTDPAEGLGLDAIRATHDLLLRSGWPIGGVNDARRVLDRLKGGGMARLAAPASVIGLVMSDIPGGGLEDVASGPLSPARRGCRDVEIALRRGDALWGRLPDEVQRFLEARRSRVSLTPPPVKLLGIGSGDGVVDAVDAEAARLGYSTRRLGTSLSGDARTLGGALVRTARAVRDRVVDVPAPACLIGAGEVTVEVRGPGSGGPNQEVAVGAALALEGFTGVLIVSLGTDGIDGPTDAAGGWADGSSVQRAHSAGIDLEAALVRNDSGSALKALGDRIVTGPTGTNVADLYLVLVDEAH